MENHRSLCPVNLVVEILGDKWSLLILRDIILEDKRYFGELRESEEKIATNILSERLKMLESKDLLSRSSDPGHKQKVRYSLTRKSIDLIPMILESIIWSLKYEPVDRNAHKAAIDLVDGGVPAREELQKRLIAIHLPETDKNILPRAKAT